MPPPSSLAAFVPTSGCSEGKNAPFPTWKRGSQAWRATHMCNSNRERRCLALSKLHSQPSLNLDLAGDEGSFQMRNQIKCQAIMCPSCDRLANEEEREDKSVLLYADIQGSWKVRPNWMVSDGKGKKIEACKFYFLETRQRRCCE